MPGTTGEPEDASPGAAPTAPTTPAAGTAPTASRTGRRPEVTRASTRDNPNEEDTVDSSVVPRALLLAHAIRPGSSDLTLSQLLEIAAKASGFVRDRNCRFFSLGWRSLCLFEGFRLRHRSFRSQRNLGQGKSAPQNPQQLQERGETAPIEGLARSHSERDGQRLATRRLQTGQHLQRSKRGEDNRLKLRRHAEGRRAIQGQTRRSRPRPRTWD